MKNHMKAARLLTDLLENKFRILGIRFGLDPVFGLIPGFGDIASALMSFYVIWIAIRMNLPQKEIEKMVRNVIIDLLIGIVPIAGDFIDIFYRANTRNLKILEKYKDEKIIEGKIIE